MDSDQLTAGHTVVSYCSEIICEFFDRTIHRQFGLCIVRFFYHIIYLPISNAINLLV